MRALLLIAFCFTTLALAAQGPPTTQDTDTSKKTSVVRSTHEKQGSVYLIDEHMTVKHIARHQRYNRKDSATYDVDIHSPKSVNLNPEGTRYYVNSLEGYKTVVYDVLTHQKVRTVKHTFSVHDSALWAKPSGFYQFQHEYVRPNSFSGKPVESAFSHYGRYLWVPYYRRSFDLNAQEPSAMAVIDTYTHCIVRIFETGALPKMVAASDDGHWIAVTHWGENTVGLIDISSSAPSEWHYTDNFTVDYKLKLDLSLTEPVNRDVKSGYCLRGTVFTPDGRYLLVGCMGGSGGIAVIDLESHQYLGRVLGMMSNVRHLLIHEGWLYLSINTRGAVQKIRLDEFLAQIPNMQKRKVRVDGWQTCKVAAGARTIEISTDGRYVYAACNVGSCLAVIDNASFQMIGTIPVDSYPVGLDISKDGKTIYVTSQGRNDKGGNAVNVFQIDFLK